MQDETVENLLIHLERLDLQTGQRPIYLNTVGKHQIVKNLELLNDLRESFGLEPLKEYPINAYEQTELQKSSIAYTIIHSHFNAKFNQLFSISKIMEVKNTFLTLQYNLMKEKYRERGEFVSDKTMFHGTNYAYLGNICTYNFDRSKVNISNNYYHDMFCFLLYLAKLGMC